MPKVKVIVAGSRDFTSRYFVLDQISQYLDELYKRNKKNKFILVCGMAKGVDECAYWICKQHGIKIKQFPADWDTHGKKAGILRNIEMAEYADELLAIHKHNSKGTAHMIKHMKKLGKPVKVIKIGD